MIKGSLQQQQTTKPRAMQWTTYRHALPADIATSVHYVCRIERMTMHHAMCPLKKYFLNWSSQVFFLLWLRVGLILRWRTHMICRAYSLLSVTPDTCRWSHTWAVIIKVRKHLSHAAHCLWVQLCPSSSLPGAARFMSVWLRSKWEVATV